MPIVESRLKDGVLKLGTSPTEIDFSCQVTNVRIGSSYDDDGDAVETLCGDQLAPGRKLSGRQLAGTIIQDWTADQSIIDFCWTHDLEEMAFTFTPNADAGPTISGTVRIEVPSETYGGDVNTRITSDFEWGMTSAVTRTPPVAGDAQAATETSTPEREPANA